MHYKNFSLLSLIILLLICSCEKIEDLTTFDIKNNTQVSIPAQGIVKVPLIIRSPEVQTSAEQTFKNNNTRADLVETASLSNLKLSILAPENQNFDFLNVIKIYIKDEAGKEALLASSENIPEDGRRVLELETSGADLKPFIQQENYTIRTEATTDQVLNQDVDIRVDMVFTVKAKVF